MSSDSEYSSNDDGYEAEITEDTRKELSNFLIFFLSLGKKVNIFKYINYDRFKYMISNYITRMLIVSYEFFNCIIKQCRVKLKMKLPPWISSKLNSQKDTANRMLVLTSQRKFLKKLYKKLLEVQLKPEKL